MDDNAQSIQDEIDQISRSVSMIDYRLKYSEMLHRKVGPDGDIYHYHEIVKNVWKAAFLGAAVAIILNRLFIEK